MNNRPFVSGQISHIVWDWNGTLFDDASLCVDVISEILVRFDLPPINLEYYGDTFRFPVKDYYVDLGFDFEKTPFEELGVEFIKNYTSRDHECRLRENSEKVLKYCAESGFSQSVLSASESRRLKNQAERLGVREFFDPIIALDNHFAGGKLNIGKQWIGESGLDPHKVLLIGDTDHDAEVAKNLGIECVLVHSGHQSRKRLENTGFRLLNNLDNLIGLL